MEIVPFVSGRNVRLLESPLSQIWLSGLMGFPNMVHDDETQAFYAAVNPFVSILDGKRVIDQGQREPGRNKVPKDAEYD
jgi:phage terminase large subunit-like protein